MMWRGSNAGGVWDSAAKRAAFHAMPDKEAPLWNPYSPIIYWWTADELDDNRAYRVAYNGYVNPLPKQVGAESIGFRCCPTE